MWKILTAQISEEIYDLQISRRLFTEEQKGYLNWTRGSGEQLCIDEHILKDSKVKRKNLVMAKTEYKKTYDKLPHSWIIDCLKMYKISGEVIKSIKNTMQN